MAYDRRMREVAEVFLDDYRRLLPPGLYARHVEAMSQHLQDAAEAYLADVDAALEREREEPSL
jgi:hypothetical protein